MAQNQADIAVLKAYSDAQDTRLRAEGTREQARLENRWGKFLMPLLRQHHEAIQSLPPLLTTCSRCPNGCGRSPDADGALDRTVVL